MMADKWTREGAMIHKDGILFIPLDVTRYAVARTAGGVEQLMADANYGAAIRPFAEAAEKAIVADRAWNELVNQQRHKVGLTTAHTDLLDALALLPNPPKPTLAEQGEEIKAFIEQIRGTRYYWPAGGVLANDKDLDKLKAMVDAIVAGKE